MCSKQNRRFKSKHFQYDYGNKWIESVKKPFSFKRKCKFDRKKCNSNQKWNNDKCLCKCKIEKHCVHRKDYIWNPATYSCENSKYVGSTIDDSVITSDEIMEETRTVPTSFDEKKINILLAFSLIFVVL